MYRIFFTLLFLSVMSVMSIAQTASKLFDKLIYTEKGDSLPYRLLKPVNPQAMESFPLVIFLHGAGERGNDNEVHIKHITELVLEPRNRGKYPCYVVAPQCPKNIMWANFEGSNGNRKVRETPSRPMQMVINLIEQVIKEYPIDESRIYITGLSMGGFATWELLARFPEKFAAAVPVCGGGAPSTANAFSHVPIWAFHGAKDKIVVPAESRRMIQALREAGASPGYTEYPDVEHNSWVYAYDEPHLIHWMFRQKLETTTTKRTSQ